MKKNLFLFLLIGLVVYLVVKANRQLVATQAAIQTDNNLVAIEPGETIVNNNTVVQQSQESPVDYLSAYNQA